MCQLSAQWHCEWREKGFFVSRLARSMFLGCICSTFLAKKELCSRPKCAGQAVMLSPSNTWSQNNVTRRTHVKVSCHQVLDFPGTCSHEGPPIRFLSWTECLMKTWHLISFTQNASQANWSRCLPGTSVLFLSHRIKTITVFNCSTHHEVLQLPQLSR